jgi:hypothetical protein
VGAALLGACDEQPQTTPSKTAPAAQSTGVLAQKRWLDVKDPTPPELWLASREAKIDLPLSATDVDTFRELIARAGRRYVETPRMIANRTVQLEEMLAAHGIVESARLVIEGLVALRGEGDERRGFGEAVQQYFNIRSAGLSREQALLSLKTEQQNRH